LGARLQEGGALVLLLLHVDLHQLRGRVALLEVPFLGVPLRKSGDATRRGAAAATFA
jgi:hypothetical protein